MTIRILESAKNDLKSGYEFYENQAPGLGDYFLDSLYSDIDSLLIYAGIHAIRFEGYHCMFSKRFPFAIYYYVDKDAIFLDAILDCRQNPKKTEKRLDD
ncbi:type II toxin-antitoxin system RelE/ParE family toxin [Gracilimonas sp.]|uniref:type II toxin-antitoxin system RelE/ParE family toxin n=1 Tax=Gracilimonas sp. TaxID=1974203 RepID=UPI002872A9AA|nr:hypothetical protein [Gracilimonas sp.]